MILSRRAISFSTGVLVLTIISGGADATEPSAGATSCSGCHSTSTKVETLVPPLRGRDAAEIISAMQGFRSGERPSTVMGRIAKGFSAGEIQAIAVWLAAQQK